MDEMLGGEVGERIDELGRRFQDAIVVRLERRATVLRSELTPARVDDAVRIWLGAAAEEILRD